MLKSFTPISKVLPIGEDVGVVGMLPEAVSELKFVGFDVRLQLQAQDRFLALYNEEWKDCIKKFAGFQTGRSPYELRSVFSVSLGMVVDVLLSAKLFVQGVYDRFIGHADSNANLPANMGGLRLLPNINAGVAFAIEQTSSISKFHDSSLVVADMSANSGNTQNGQSRTKQAARPGARREQVRTAKAKICSELRGNTQTLAEMTRGHVGADYSTHELTDCNTNYIFLRPHKDRNFVPIGGERQSVNQDAIVKLIGWAGNMTSSGPQFCGVLIA